MQATLLSLDELRRGPIWQEWRELARAAPPFLAPEMFALARSLTDGGDVVVATAREEDGRLAGVLPLVRRGHTLCPLRSDHSPGFDYCGSLEGVEAIWAMLRDEPSWSELVLDKLPATSHLVAELTALAMVDNCPTIISDDPAHPYFALQGFAGRMNHKFKANVVRCQRKAGDVVLERIAVPTEADLAEALQIEALAWKAAAGTHIAADPRAVHMYRVLARLYGRRGQAALYFLRVAGKRVATLFALEDRHTLYALKIGYDPSYASLPAGGRLAYSFPLAFGEAAEARFVRFAFVPLEGRGLGISELQVFEGVDVASWPQEIHLPGGP